MCNRSSCALTRITGLSSKNSSGQVQVVFADCTGAETRADRNRAGLAASHGASEDVDGCGAVLDGKRESLRIVEQRAGFFFPQGRMWRVKPQQQVQRRKFFEQNRQYRLERGPWLTRGLKLECRITYAMARQFDTKNLLSANPLRSQCFRAGRSGAGLLRHLACGEHGDVGQRFLNSLSGKFGLFTCACLQGNGCRDVGLDDVVGARLIHRRQEPLDAANQIGYLGLPPFTLRSQWLLKNASTPGRATPGCRGLSQCWRSLGACGCH